MTELVYSPKIRPEHLARRAIVYLRQSSEKQEFGRIWRASVFSTK